MALTGEIRSRLGARTTPSLVLWPVSPSWSSRRGRVDAVSDGQERILLAARQDSCPQCLVSLGSERVGSGRLADGIFCSLDCLVAFHADYFEARVHHGVPSQD